MPTLVLPVVLLLPLGWCVRTHAHTHTLHTSVLAAIHLCASTSLRMHVQLSRLCFLQRHANACTDAKHTGTITPPAA